MMLSNWKHVENLETLRIIVDIEKGDYINLWYRDAQNDENYKT